MAPSETTLMAIPPEQPVTSLNSAACPAERPSTACLASRPQSPQRPSGNAGKWIFFLPTEGDEIIIHTSFLRTTKSLAANMRPPAFVHTRQGDVTHVFSSDASFTWSFRRLPETSRLSFSFCFVWNCSDGGGPSFCPRRV